MHYFYSITLVLIVSVLRCTEAWTLDSSCRSDGNRTNYQATIENGMRQAFIYNEAALDALNAIGSQNNVNDSIHIAQHDLFQYLFRVAMKDGKIDASYSKFQRVRSAFQAVRRFDKTGDGLSSPLAEEVPQDDGLIVYCDWARFEEGKSCSGKEHAGVACDRDLQQDVAMGPLYKSCKTGQTRAPMTFTHHEGKTRYAQIQLCSEYVNNANKYPLKFWKDISLQALLAKPKAVVSNILKGAEPIDVAAAGISHTLFHDMIHAIGQGEIGDVHVHETGVDGLDEDDPERSASYGWANCLRFSPYGPNREKMGEAHALENADNYAYFGLGASLISPTGSGKPQRINPDGSLQVIPISKQRRANVHRRALAISAVPRDEGSTPSNTTGPLPPASPSTKPVTTKPDTTEPTSTKPTDVPPASPSTKLATTKPDTTEPTSTKPIDLPPASPSTKPATTKPDTTEPTSTKPTEPPASPSTKPATTATTETTNTEPANTQPGTTLTSTKPGSIKPTAPQPPESPTSKAATTQPANTQPANTQPANTQPANTEHANTQPVNTSPGTTTLTTTKPDSIKPTDPPPPESPTSKATTTEPANTQPPHTKPATTGPVDSPTASPSTKPPTTKPANKEPTGTTPTSSPSTSPSSKPVTTEPTSTKPTDLPPASPGPKHTSTKPIDSPPASPSTKLATTEPVTTKPTGLPPTSPIGKATSTKPLDSPPASPSSKPASTGPVTKQPTNTEPVTTKPTRTKPTNSPPTSPSSMPVSPHNSSVASPTPQTSVTPSSTAEAVITPRYDFQDVYGDYNFFDAAQSVLSALEANMVPPVTGITPTPSAKFTTPISSPTTKTPKRTPMPTPTTTTTTTTTSHPKPTPSAPGLWCAPTGGASVGVPVEYAQNNVTDFCKLEESSMFGPARYNLPVVGSNIRNYENEYDLPGVTIYLNISLVSGEFNITKDVCHNTMNEILNDCAPYQKQDKEQHLLKFGGGIPVKGPKGTASFNISLEAAGGTSN